MPAERLRNVQSRSGKPNVEVDGLPYHSTYDPIRECQKFYSALPLENADVVLHFGWGLGYGGDVLCRRVRPASRVIVLEPDEELFSLFCRRKDHEIFLKDQRFRFVVGERECQHFDDWGIDGCQENDNFLWVEWPAAVRLRSALARALKTGFKTRLRDRAANLLTHFQNGRLYFQNAIANMKYASDPTAGQLFGRFAGVPLVLVSAGPSLDRNVRYLAGLESRCFILAVDTALRPLLAAGVKPHTVVIADPSELNAQHIIGALPHDTFLIAEQAVHPEAMATACKRFQFSVGVFPDSLFREFDLPRTAIEVWGSVATAAIDLACRFGCDPIIMAGQDFAYSWDRNYASHTIFDGNGFDPASTQFVQATDVWGRTVPTTENLVAYRDFFVRRFRTTPGKRFINATEGGILIEGAEVLPLRAALYQVCRSPVPIRRMIEACHRTRVSNSFLQAHVESVLSSRSGDCNCLGSFLELTAKEALLKDDNAGIETAITWGLSELRRVRQADGRNLS